MNIFKKVSIVAVVLSIVIAGMSLPIKAAAVEKKPPSQIVIQNVNIFDGVNDKLATGMSVLVEGNRIAKIAKSILVPASATVIDGKGKVLMPGLIDAHWHTMYNFAPISQILGADFGNLNIAAADASQKTLLRGFTTVRDMGGNSFGVKRAIDQGIATGPRIYPSGPHISQTSGHGDFRGPNDVPRTRETRWTTSSGSDTR